MEKEHGVTNRFVIDARGADIGLAERLPKILSKWGAAAAIQTEFEITRARRAAEERASQYRAVADARDAQERVHVRRIDDGMYIGTLSGIAGMHASRNWKRAKVARIYWPFWLSIIAIVVTLWVLYVLSCGAIQCSK